MSNEKKVLQVLIRLRLAYGNAYHRLRKIDRYLGWEDVRSIPESALLRLASAEQYLFGAIRCVRRGCWQGSQHLLHELTPVIEESLRDYIRERHGETVFVEESTINENKQQAERRRGIMARYETNRSEVFAFLHSNVIPHISDQLARLERMSHELEVDDPYFSFLEHETEMKRVYGWEAQEIEQRIDYWGRIVCRFFRRRENDDCDEFFILRYDSSVRFKAALRCARYGKYQGALRQLRASRDQIEWHFTEWKSPTLRRFASKVIPAIGDIIERLERLEQQTADPAGE